MTDSGVHPTAMVDPAAELGQGVQIGPGCIIEGDTRIGNETRIGAYSMIRSGTTIGKACNIFQFCSIGEIPQDMKYDGEKTFTRIGDNVTIREYVSINRGTSASGTTAIGNSTLLMAYVHIAHDCQIGNNVILANLVTLGGHVEIGDWASLGGGVLVHQFSRVGAHAFIGGGYRIVQDVPPFILAAGEPLRFGGINSVGLKRRGFSAEERGIIKKTYRIYFRSGMNRGDALKSIQSQLKGNRYVEQILAFIADSDRGII